MVLGFQFFHLKYSQMIFLTGSYWSDSGMILIGQKRFRRALELLHNVCHLSTVVFILYSSSKNQYDNLIPNGLSIIFQVVTAPMSSINAIAVEAYKKYILVSLVLHGQVCYVLSFASLFDLYMNCASRSLCNDNALSNSMCSLES